MIVAQELREAKVAEREKLLVSDKNVIAVC